MSEHRHDEEQQVSRPRYGICPPNTQVMEKKDKGWEEKKKSLPPFQNHVLKTLIEALDTLQKLSLGDQGSGIE